MTSTATTPIPVDAIHDRAIQGREYAAKNLRAMIRITLDASASGYSMSTEDTNYMRSLLETIIS